MSLLLWLALVHPPPPGTFDVLGFVYLFLFTYLRHLSLNLKLSQLGRSTYQGSSSCFSPPVLYLQLWPPWLFHGFRGCEFRSSPLRDENLSLS